MNLCIFTDIHSVNILQCFLIKLNSLNEYLQFVLINDTLFAVVVSRLPFFHGIFNNAMQSHIDFLRLTPAGITKLVIAEQVLNWCSEVTDKRYEFICSVFQHITRSMLSLLDFVQGFSGRHQREDTLQHYFNPVARIH